MPAFSAAGSDTSAIPSVEIAMAELEAGIPVLDLFARTDLCSSKSEARRLVQQGGATINDTKVTDIEAVINTSWVTDGELMLRAGKKRFFKIEAV